MTVPHRSSPLAFPFFIAAGCALLPFIAVHSAYLLAANDSFVPWCNPYIDSCTSISATGRRPPASFVFKGVMLPSAMLIAIYWWLQWRWLTQVAQERARATWMLSLGLIACLGLVLYVIVLGEVGDWLRLQRKIGTILFFSFTFLAQLLLAASLRSSARPETGGDPERLRDIGRWMLRLCVLMLALGVGSVVIQSISEAWHDAIEYALEWQLALLLQLNFLLGAVQWYRAPWELRFEARR